MVREPGQDSLLCDSRIRKPLCWQGSLRKQQGVEQNLDAAGKLYSGGISKVGKIDFSANILDVPPIHLSFHDSFPDVPAIIMVA